MPDITAEVVQRAQAGDQAACRELVEALHRPVLATVHRFLGSRYSAEVEDIAQDIFLKVFRSLHGFEADRGVKFTTWAYTFVRNHCFDVLKKRRVPTTSLARDDGVDIDPPAPAYASPTLGLHRSELAERIEAALQTLNEEQRMAFILREYEGLDYQAIGGILGVAEGTIKSRLHRAKEAMRAQLEPYLRTDA